ncbi:MAG: nickel-dependent lactate racemase [Armatimonadetes bacterium]|nr:nickel-dependent lactate racemase [Armatimonadota bacterium]
MRIDFEYGRQGLAVDLPDERLRAVLRLNPMPPLADQEGGVAAALRTPLGCQPLAELARGRRDACIVICDITRPVPNQRILPSLIATLEEAGIPSERITILIATGNHRPNEGDELVEMIGADIAARYRVVNHHSEVDEEQAYLGESRHGVGIYVDRTYVDADLKIITGLIEPHFMAGYSGGRKIVCPGLISLKTVHYFHSPALLEDERATNGVLSGNPLHEFALEVCERAGVDFSVNVVIDENRDICGVFAGALEPAHAAGVAFCDQVCRVEVDEPAEVVVTSSAGYPLDTTFYQAVKGMVGALPALKPGGTVIIAAELSEGIGSEEFSRLLFAAPDHESFMADILDPGFVFTKDQWEVEMLCRVLRRGQVMVVSDKVPAEVLNKCLVTAMPSVEAAVAAALARHGERAGIIAIPSGPYCIPTPRQPVGAGG